MPTRRVELYLHESRNVTIEGVTNVVVVDGSICAITIQSGVLHITGLELGQAAVLVWAGDRRLNLFVRVVEEPVVQPPPTLQQFTIFGAGSARSYATISTASGGSTLAVVNQFDWSQAAGPAQQLHVNGMFTDETIDGGHRFNLGTATLAYSTPKWDLNLADFGIFLSGTTGTAASYLPVSGMTLRGAEFRWRAENDSVEVFGGAGIPGYFITMAGQPRVVGTRWTHTVSRSLNFFTTAFYSNSYNVFELSPTSRHSDLTALTGLSWRPTSSLDLGGAVGTGTDNSSGSLSAAYHRDRLELFSAFNYMGASGTLTNLRVSTATGSSMLSGASYRASRRLQLNGNIQRTLPRTVPTTNGLTYESGSISAGGSASYDLRHSQTLSFDYNFTGGTRFGSITNGSIQRIEGTLQSFLGEKLLNTAEISVYRYGAGDLKVDQHTDLTMQDSARWHLRPAMALLGSFSYGRTGLPLIERIRENLSMLDPSQLALFQQDPVAFINSAQFPPALQAAFDSLQSGHVTATTGLELTYKRLHITPSLKFSFNDLASGGNVYQFGYSADYLVGSLLLQSSLTRQQYVMPDASTIRSTTQFTVGVLKRMNNTPVQWLSQKLQRNRIHGRVFVDRNIRGIDDGTSPGMTGIRVLLDDGEVATTDEKGEFQFSGLPARMYTISVPLDQFPSPVRMTTASPIRVDLTQHRSANVPFGIVNFARLQGMVYNDYTMQGVRAPDAPGLDGLKLALRDSNGEVRTIKSENGGEYVISNLEPGQYELVVDPTSMPSNYELPERRFKVELQPASSFILDIPLRAIRTISGVVLFQENGAANVAPRPIPNVLIEAADQLTRTGADGSFLLRRLPAGEVTLRILPGGSSLPPGIDLPNGKVHLSREPQQIEGVRIVISNPKLLNYLSHEDVRAQR